MYPAAKNHSNALVKKLYWLIFPIVLIGLLVMPVNYGQAAEYSEAVDWNLNKVIRSDGLYYQYATGWANFVDSEGKWHKINMIPEMAVNGFDVTQAPYRAHLPVYADEPFVLINNNGYDHKLREFITVSDLSSERTFTTAAHVEGSRVGNVVKYKSAFPDVGADLEVKILQDGVKFEMVWNEYPASCKERLDIPFETSYNDDVDQVGKKSGKLGNNFTDVSAGLTSNVSKYRALSVKKIEGIDAAGKPVNVQLSAKSANRLTSFVKTVTCEALQSAVFPVRVDDFLSVDTDPGVDGDCSYSNATWAGARSAASASVCNTSNIYNIVQAQQNPPFYIGRSLLSFQTTSWDDAATVTGAVLKLRKRETVDSLGDSISIYFTSLIGSTSLSTSDYDRANFGGSKIAPDTLWSAFGADYVSITFNGTGTGGINKTGYTEIAVISKLDTDNVEPTSGQDSYIQFYSHEQGAGYEPILELYGGVVPPASSSSSSSPTLSGSLLGMTGTCGSYSGTSLCTQWNYHVDVEMVGAFVRKGRDIVFGAGIFFLLAFVILYFIRSTTRWTARFLKIT